ncbi:hypothetical protein [Burkholderia metallica]|uniref:hypothetical protein n=1 Tax=Burkholderia metallica TaxID=488729 RepID=UPI00157BA07A|nr:hypothetical protein [Burkholderia metallica]
MVAWTTDPAAPRGTGGGRPVEAGLSATVRPPTIDDMLHEPKEKLMRYAECRMGPAPSSGHSPVFQENLSVLTASNPAAKGTASKIGEKEISLVRTTGAGQPRD